MTDGEGRGATGLALALLLALVLVGLPAGAAEDPAENQGDSAEEMTPVPPGPPRNLAAIYNGPHPGDPQHAEISVTWEAPEDSGGEPIQGYALATEWRTRCPAMTDTEDLAVDEHARPDYTSSIGQYLYGEVYCWKVRAFTDAEGLKAGPWSEPVSLTAER